MQRHACFDLWLHEDGELAAIIGSPIVERATIHEWPLSCVQRVRCASGVSYVYKAQGPPTVEPAFYKRAHSPLLVIARALPHEHGPDALLMEDIPATTLAEQQIDETRRLDVVNDILIQIAQIDGDLPALIDICTPERWHEHANAIHADLQAHVEEKRFKLVTPAMIEQFDMQVNSSLVLSAIQGSTGFVHMDLRAENVLVLERGYRVLDWQRPILGPVALDRVTLMKSLGLNPTLYGFGGVMKLRKLLLIGWLTQAARYWFPPGTPTYDEEVARLITSI